MSVPNQRKGFTLVEVLVAITIVAVLSSVGLVTYVNSQVKARDARRKDDLKAIKVALETYYTKNNQYPVVSAQVDSSANSPWIPGLDSSVITTLPTDPTSNNWSDTDPTTHGYAYDTPNDHAGVTIPAGCPTGTGQYFYLKTRLENSSDPDTCLQKSYTDCSGASYCPIVVCPGGKCGPSPTKNNYVVTSQ